VEHQHVRGAVEQEPALQQPDQRPVPLASCGLRCRCNRMMSSLF
jgi:hypothetical protein